MVHSLKSKNNSREAEINRMIQEADDLMRKYTHLKEKSLKFKEQMVDNYKYLNTAIGSKLIYYTLENIYHNNTRTVVQLFKNFSDFDKKFFLSLKRLSMINQKQIKKLKQEILSRWYKNALSSFAVSKSINKVNCQIITDKKSFKGSMSCLEKTNRCHINNHSKETAKLKLSHVLGKYMIRYQLHIFIKWKEYTKDFNDKKIALKLLAAKMESKAMKLHFESWKLYSIQIIQSCKLQLLVKDCSQRHYLQTLFSCFRNKILETKHQALDQKRRTFSAWKIEAKTMKHLKNMRNSLIKYSQVKQINLIQKANLSLKINSKIERNDRFEQILNQSNSEREHSETSLYSSVSNVDNKQLYRCLDIFTLQLQKQLQSYFSQWRKVVDYRRQYLKTKFFYKVLHLYEYDVKRTYMNQWRYNVSELIKDEAQIYNQSLLEKKNSLTGQCSSSMQEIDNIIS